MLERVDGPPADEAPPLTDHQSGPVVAASTGLRPQPDSTHGPDAIAPRRGRSGVAELKLRVKRVWLGLESTRETSTAFAYDCRRYLRYSSTRGAGSHQHNLAAKITERYHMIEKGLSLPEPRPGFGRGVIPRLVELIELYLVRFGEDAVITSAVGALRAYQDFNLSVGVPLSELPASDRLGALLERANVPVVPVGGTREISRQEINAAVAGVDLGFFTSRHSTRVFEHKPVTEAEIEFALAAATTAPAVCNREFSAVTIWKERDEIGSILRLQGGARGFAEEVSTLAMVSVSVRTFWSAAERNQAWVDGGMFAMNFILGLHAQGLGAVPLNWSKPPTTDRAMRSLIGLPDDRVIIMFIAFGHLKDHYRVAASPRRPISAFRLALGDDGRATPKAG